ncbi:hypothetical protein AtubIFM54640_001331 [Aspergillus tubingensis]|nr:hypothetical protein AtubIFM54640_001331 [Aspergillus tubingensis]
MKWLSAISHAPILKITIKDPRPSYATWDRVEGTVTVTAPYDTNVNNIQITFEGSSRVSLPRPITELREPAACHTFLKLQQPIETPISPTHVPGRTSTYPFCFVIPEELPLGSCIHEKSNGCADHWHAKLPPTLRFANLSQELCRIAYSIRGKLWHERENNYFYKRYTICPGASVEPPPAKPADLCIIATQPEAGREEQSIAFSVQIICGRVFRTADAGALGFLEWLLRRIYHHTASLRSSGRSAAFSTTKPTLYAQGVNILSDKAEYQSAQAL